MADITGADNAGGFVDPDTRLPLPTWDEALDAIGEDDPPAHVARFGTQIGVEGVLAGTPQADKCIGYLVKYLTKSLGDDLATVTTDGDEPGTPTHTTSHHHDDQTGRQAWWTAHRDRLVDALRYEPCSPTCPNWLRYGVQPRNAKPHHRPGCCRSKAHKPTHLGHAGRRVLVSRKWTGKTLADHKNDRRAFVLNILGVTPTSDTYPGPAAAANVAWEYAKTTDPDVPPLSRRLLLAIAQRHAGAPNTEPPATRHQQPNPVSTPGPIFRQLPHPTRTPRPSPPPEQTGATDRGTRQPHRPTTDR